MFTVRIELKGRPGSSDYENLHSTMAQAGFSRTIVATDGQRYMLPHAEYDYTGSASDIGAVCTAATNSAKKVWSSVAVFVTQGDARRFVGLDVVPTPRSNSWSPSRY